MSTDSTKEKIIAFLRGIVIVGYLVYAPYYLYWRLGTFNPDAMVFSWFIWGAEVFGYVTAILHVFMVNRLTSPTASSPPAGYSVDVFITAYNESVSLLTHTLRVEWGVDLWDGSPLGFPEQFVTHFLSLEGLGVPSGDARKVLAHA